MEFRGGDIYMESFQGGGAKMGGFRGENMVSGAKMGGGCLVEIEMVSGAKMGGGGVPRRKGKLFWACRIRAAGISGTGGETPLKP